MTKARNWKLVLNLFSLTFFLLSYTVFGQCPIANSCTPGSAPASSFPFGMGIYNVVISGGVTGFSNPTTSGASQGYQDYSCTQKATVLEGVSTSISVTTNPNVNENVKVWLEMNNNGVFDNTTELIFSSINAKVHTGTFTIPVSASVVKNMVLRLRVSADNFSSPMPTPCSTPQYSQIEDYGLTVVPNTNKPAVAFSVNNPVTCSPIVQFQNQTQNGATSYLWSFGDGTFSTLANPSHTYAATGTYTVKLKACNINGCDSLTRTNYITYHTNVPVAASCSPTTSSYCCGYGIIKFSFHTLVNTSQNGAAGYESFTCTKSVSVEEGQTYPLTIEGDTNNLQDFKAYIDYNNNAVFELNELVYSTINAVKATDSITIAAGAATNIPLRMRIISDNQGTPISPCSNPVTGQVEDYTVIITPNTRLPKTSFLSSFVTSCDTVVQFTDLSKNAVTAWLWDFGDGSPISTQKNPQHTYSNNGTYSIKLKTCNAIGCDSIFMPNYITIIKPCLTYCTGSNNNNQFWTTNVTFNTINNTSGKDPNGYGNYVNQSTSVVKGNTYTFSAGINPDGLGHRTTVFIDYNQDGDFYDKNELVLTGTGFFTFTRSIKIDSKALVGVTRMRVITSNDYIVPLPCSFYGYHTEIEDYSLRIQPANLTNQKPEALFSTAETNNNCSYSVAFTDTSSYMPSSWFWNFGDPATGINNFSNDQNPTHTYSGPGIYSVRLITCNSYGCDTLFKAGYVAIQNDIGPRPAACISQTINSYGQWNFGIYSVKLNTINNVTQYSGIYSDYSCTQQTSLLVNQPYNLKIRTQYFSDVKGWLDFNDDGIFDEISELIYASPQIDTVHIATITSPANVVLNRPLRMRISNDMVLLNQLPIPHTPCDPVHVGQAEDYAVSFVTSLISGVNSMPNTQKIKLYPNPNRGIFSVELPSVSKGNIQIEVQNLIGQKVVDQELKQPENILQMDLSYLPKGIYLLRISNSGYSDIKKIVIE